MPAVFQSTSSVWRTTQHPLQLDHLMPISIHVLRVEDNGPAPDTPAAPANFNPRPPCGGQPPPPTWGQSLHIFQSTSSVWRTTRSYQIPRVQAKFQSTSSVWRTTPQVPRTRHHCANFNPRPPCGGQQGDDLAAQADPVISIHVLRVEDNLRKHVDKLH